jgi:hopanoid biosynthesis associated protein HpnK
MGSKARGSEAGRRRLIVNADDLGRSHSINQAILRAHREGILTTASLMVNEAACAEAVELARANPQLGVGLHLTLLCGHSALCAAEVPGLVNAQNEFTNNATAAGFRYFFQNRLREQLRREIHEQFKKFRSFGLPLDHVNGHLHLHLHPLIFSILMEGRAQLGIEAVRLTYDPFWLNLQLAPGRFLYRSVHAVIFQALAARARPHLERGGFKHTDQVFGLLQNGRVGKNYVCQLLNRLPRGDSELYSHPSLDDFKEEFEALISPRVCEQVRALGIELIRYQDL